jgi:hypothetical protein
MTVAVSIPPDMVWGIIREVIKEGLLDEPNEDDL